MSVADGTLDGARHGPVRDPPSARSPCGLAAPKASANQLLELEVINPLRHVHRLPDLRAVPDATGIESRADRP